MKHKTIKKTVTKHVIFFFLSIMVGYGCWWLLRDTSSFDHAGISSPSGELWSGDLSEIPIVKVGSTIITVGDVDFEHRLLTQVLRSHAGVMEITHSSWREIEDIGGGGGEGEFDREEGDEPGEGTSESSHVYSSRMYSLGLTHNYSVATNSAARDDAADGSVSMEQLSWAPLREFILKLLIRRRVLFQMVQNDPRMDLSDIEIYKECFGTWKEVLKENPDFFKSTDHRKRLQQKTCEDHVIERYIEKHVISQVSVSDLEAREYYARHRSEFVLPQSITVRHIQLAHESEAKQVRAQLSPANFERLAREYSIAPEASLGGLLEPYTPAGMPSFLGEAFRFRVNRVSPIVKSSYGYHVFLPLEKTGGGEVMSFEKARPRIIEYISQQKRREQKQRWYSQALNTIPVRAESYLKSGGPI